MNRRSEPDRFALPFPMAQNDTSPWIGIPPSDRDTYLSYCRFLNIAADCKVVAGGDASNRFDPRRDTQRCLKNIFDDAKIAKHFEQGMIEEVDTNLNALGTVKSWRDSDYLHLYVSFSRERIALLRRYPDKVMEIKRLSPQSIKSEAKKDSYSFVPSAWRAIRDADIARKQKLAFRKGVDIYCKNCGNSNCSFYLLQTSSADEPEDMMITCNVCGTRWSKKAA